MNIIMLSDLHLTSNTLDEYRWKWLDEFTEWMLIEWAENPSAQNYTILVLLGDITENKDKHSNELVNRFAELLDKWRQMVDKVLIITGNHDGVDVSKPFFRFVSSVKNVQMITMPKSIKHLSSSSEKCKCLFLPHSKDPAEQWKDFFNKEFDYIFMHQAVNRSITSSGFEMDNVFDLDLFRKGKGKMYSGDIHVPQKVGRLTYVGSPYPIYFGDNFEGRFIVIENKIERSVSIPSIAKRKLRISSFEELENTELNEDDQLAIEYSIDRSEQSGWMELKRKVRDYVKKKKAVIVSLELIVPKSNESIKLTKKQKKTRNLKDEDYVKEYGKRNKLNSDFVQAGIDILREEEND